VTTRKKPSKEHEKKRETRDAALMKGTEELLALGWDLETLEPTAETVDRLGSVRPPSRDSEQAIACWLGFVELPEAAALLSRMERTADKDLKREIRRSLFRLEQRGVRAERLSSAEPTAGILAREKDRGFFSAVDGRGDQVVWYVREEGSGDYFVLSGVINDGRGLLEADAGRVARPAFRELLEETRQRFSLRLLPGDAAWSDLVLYEAYRNSGSRRGAGVARFPSFRMEILHRAPDRIPCPVFAALDRDGIRADEELVGASDRLLGEKELAGWLLDPEWMAPHLPAFREAVDSPLVLNRYQKQERIEQSVLAAGRSIFPGEVREAYARRLEAMAYYFLLDGREPAARRALAVSLAMRAAAGAELLPFERELTLISFRAAEESEKLRAREEKRSSLIVKPGEA
jgi:hypothetical protein